ncbi:MAG: hypothetical protein IPJ95_19310 [Gemmatimonadetes bacterium]|nr:hypothetical protein [Gemmatimonadota bacterium]
MHRLPDRRGHLRLPAASASATRDRCRNGPRMIRRRSSCRRATSTFRVTTPSPCCATSARSRVTPSP